MPAEFIKRYQLDPECIDGQKAVSALMDAMKLGLEGKGNIPMNPSYLSLDTTPKFGIPCCVMDAGGTNLRSASAVFQEDGQCVITALSKVPMLAIDRELSYQDFYSQLGEYANAAGHTERIGFCFSYNVEHQRTLDGILQSWCKEIRVPDAVGKPVGTSLSGAIGSQCQRVSVVNDSTAALLGAHHRNRNITIGVILGTGINICYSENCARIPKVPQDLASETMIISTEIGEFKDIPKSMFDEAVIAESDEPEMAHAEKQCSGAYLGDIIHKAWHAAAQEGLLDVCFADPVTLPDISNYLADKDSPIPDNSCAKQIASVLIHRAAKIAAILTAGVVRFCHQPGQHCTMVIEGSQYEKLTGFAANYRTELDALLAPHQITYDIAQTVGSCLVGAALAAFAEPM